jgi:RNA polymerase-binding transcription factor DksA
MTSPEEPAPDGAEESVEVAAERALERIEASLAAIERAIDGFDDGTYGVCEICGHAVEQERLAARASERRCAAHVANGPL